ncbi:discoidin domain-containing protein [Streptomyces sp. NPDC029004]|uniref:discoidin domain-containing protein n=1 Tax=Streptomyces sp. NPDC029004 TaxID=3154490 RepID=UPI0033FF0BB0
MTRRLLARLVLVGALLLGALTLQSPARADLEHPRQDFLRSSVGGLFLHWGQRTAPSHTSCSQWESDVTGGGWTPDYWVQEAQKLHTQYLVLATFHSRLGYARPWPSKIPGSCSTKRDFLGELITAAKAKGLKTILYMTDDPQWHDEGGHEWLDSAAYSKYKGRNVDLTGRDGFGEFSYDNFFEVMDRYPDLGGFWIDNDNAYWESHSLYAQVYQKRPNYTISNNNEDTPIMDMISNEQKTGMSPSYDYPQAVYTAAPRLVEADFKLPSTGSWWYTGSDPAVDRKLTLGRLITNAGSSVKALMAETAMVGGRLPGNQAAFNNFAKGYLDAIAESLHGTEGGGYLHGGLAPGFWNDGSHGVTTVSRTDPDKHYIHVLTPPSASTLRLRDNGYRVTGVRNLRTGAPIAYGQSGGTLSLSGLGGWDPYDTVFKVTTAGREGIVPASSYTMSASASAGGHGAAAAADGDYRTYWDSDKTTPVSLRFDLGSAKRVQYIGVNQREDSVSYARSGTEQSARIRDYRVYVSNDGTTWGSPVRTGTLPSRRGVAIIDIPVTTTRHVRLEVVNTHAASSDSARYKRLRIDESWIGSAYAAGGGTTPTPGRYEAEDASYSTGSTVDSDHTGFTGTGFVNTPNAAGAYVEWAVQSATARSASIAIRYANGTTAGRPLDVSVNGTVVSANRAFDGTGAWTTWADSTLTVPLSAGANTVRVTATGANGAPNLDHLDVEAPCCV